MTRPAVAALLALGLVGCRGDGGAVDGAGAPPLLVMAAASLNTAMPAVVEGFEATSDTPVEVVLGATANLAAQIEHGAPADLFFSADVETVERLVAAGELRPESVRTYAVGELVVVWRNGSQAPANLEALADPSYESIAIANPEHAPYGTAAREALRRIGVWEDIEPRVVFGENVSQTYQLVRTGNADVGLVARSVLRNTPARDLLRVDPDLHPPIRQAAGILTRTTHPAAERFLEFVMGEAGQAILAEYGLAAPR